MRTGLSKLRVGDLVRLGKETCLTVDRDPFVEAGRLGGEHWLIGAGGRLWCVNTGNLLIEQNPKRYDSRTHIISQQLWDIKHAAVDLDAGFWRLSNRAFITDDYCSRDVFELAEKLSPAAVSELLQLFSRAVEIIDLAERRDALTREQQNKR